MQLVIGYKIRELRRRSGRTQEALAEILGVSAQAVSRWEAGGSCPDIGLLPGIANCFGVSIDELFGCGDDREKRAEALIARIRALKEENNGTDRSMDECICAAREALIEFPGNERMMLCLASALHTAGYVRRGEGHKTDDEGFSVYDAGRHRRYPEWREAIALYEKALPLLKDGCEKQAAMEELSQLYQNTGEHEKALALAGSAPGIRASREFLKIRAYDGKQKARAAGEALLETVRVCAEGMVEAVLGFGQTLTPDEKVKSIEGAAEMIKCICPDGDFTSFHPLIAKMLMLESVYLWLDGRRGEAFGALNRALDHADAYDEFVRTGASFTSPLIRFAGPVRPENAEAQPLGKLLSESWPWWSVPEAEDVRKEMMNDPEWDAWMKRAHK